MLDWTDPGWWHSLLSLALIVAAVVERVRAVRRRRQLRKIDGPENAAEGGAPTMGRLRGDPVGWKAALQGRANSIHVVTLSSALPPLYNCFVLYKNGQTYDLEDSYEIDALTTNATRAAETLGVPLLDEAPGRDQRQLDRAPECRATLEYEQSLRRRPFAGVLLLWLSSLTLFGMAYRHHSLVRDIYEQQVSDHDAALVVAEEKIAHMKWLNDKRITYLATRKERTRTLPETPPLSGEQLEAKAQDMRPRPPKEPEPSSTSLAYGVAGLAAAIYGIVLFRRKY